MANLKKNYPELYIQLERLSRTICGLSLKEWEDFVKAIEEAIEKAEQHWVIEIKDLLTNSWITHQTFRTHNEVDHYFMELIKTVKEPHYDCIFNTFKYKNEFGNFVYLRAYDTRRNFNVSS